jgi:hypothetical protein
MTYPEVIEHLGIEKVCFGGCGLNTYRHRGSIVFGVIHWADRRVSRRGLRRLLLLVAKRERLEDPEFLNDRYLGYYHLWHDEQRANELAAQLGMRFPAEFSRVERLRCLALMGRRKLRPQGYATILDWARGANR